MNNYQITLREFQTSRGIPFDQQIILINNPGIFAGFTPCRYPYQKKRIPSVIAKLARLGKSRILPANFIKLRSNKIFAGYFDASFNYLNELDELFLQIKKQPETQFEIVVGKGDYTVDQAFSESIPNNVNRIYVNNLNTNDSRFRYLPMGRDFRSIDVFKNRPPAKEKKTLCYCNFSVNTHPARGQVLKLIEDKSFIVKQHLGEFLNYSISRSEFFDALESSKFCICPRGNAYDTFRMWDALYCGTIPIVVREAVYHEQLDGLPILFLDSYDDFGELKAETLESTYNKMLDTKYDFAKLTAAYWLGRNN